MTDPPVSRFVLFREGAFWLAQGLDHDIGVQADNLKALMSRLAVLLAAELVDSHLLHLQPSPQYFRDLWILRAGNFIPEDAYISSLPSGVRLVFGMVA